MSGYGYCDSFFVEQENSYGRAPLAPQSQHVRPAAERQQALADELSRQASEELLEDHVHHMHSMEGSTLPDVASIDIQTEIQWFMRPYLLDFLIEAHASFQLLPETLFLAVNLLDRYCSRRVVYKRHYQLVGCSSLLIAAKYGDAKENIPTVAELKAMCCNLYDEDMFKQMEWHVLQTVEWMVGHPTVDGFLKVVSRHDPVLGHLSSYICEIALFHRAFVSTRPSTLARSAMALARCILGRPQAEVGWEADYDSQTMVTLSQQLHRPSTIVSRKYSSPAYSQVACVLDDFLARQAFIARNYAPPTPPSDRRMDMVEAGKQFQTPQKPGPGVGFNNGGQGHGHGVMTPPITPEGEYFNPLRDYDAPSTPCPVGASTTSGPGMGMGATMTGFQTFGY